MKFILPGLHIKNKFLIYNINLGIINTIKIPLWSMVSSLSRLHPKTTEKKFFKKRAESWEHLSANHIFIMFDPTPKVEYYTFDVKHASDICIYFG